jgi:hypothetical protein
MARSAKVRTAVAAVTLGLSLALGACVAEPGYYAGAVLVAPPLPRVEYYGPAPYPGDVWLGGYWNWAPSGYYWVRGHWAAPRPGYRWVPHRWVDTAHGWRMTGGRWIRRR